MSEEKDQVVESAKRLELLSAQWIKFVTGCAGRPPERLSVQLSTDGFLCTLLRDEETISEQVAEAIKTSVLGLKGHINPLSIKDVEKAIRNNSVATLCCSLGQIADDFKSVEDTAIRGYDVKNDEFAPVYAERVPVAEYIESFRYKSPQSERFVAVAKIFSNAMLYATCSLHGNKQVDPLLHTREWFYTTLSILAGVGVNTVDGTPVLFTEEESIDMCSALGPGLELLKDWVFNSPQHTEEHDFASGDLKRTAAYYIGENLTSIYGKLMLGKSDRVTVVRKLFFTPIAALDGVRYRYWGNRFDEALKLCPRRIIENEAWTHVLSILSDPEMARIASLPDEDEDLYNEDFDSHEATKRSLERARAKYRTEVDGLNVRSAIFGATVIDRIRVAMRRLVEGLDEGAIPNFDLSSLPELERILLIQPWLMVRNYDIDPADWEVGGEFEGCDDYHENNGFPYVSEWKDIPEKAACMEICRLFVCAIEMSATLAKEADSKSYEDWARLVIRVKECDSSFYNFHNRTSKQPQLHEMLETIKRILPETRVDVDVYAKVKAREDELHAEETSPLTAMGDRIVSGMGQRFDALGSQIKEGFDACEQRDKELQDTAEANNALGQDALHRMKNFSKNKSFGKQWGDTVRSAMRKIWLDNKRNPTLRSNLDHPIRQEDVFEYFKNQIARYGVTELMEFKSIIEASRKTDGALKGKKIGRKAGRKRAKRSSKTEAF